MNKKNKKQILKKRSINHDFSDEINAKLLLEKYRKYNNNNNNNKHFKIVALKLVQNNHQKKKKKKIMAI